jgi:uncharacterized protein (DUF885 family)
MRGFANQRFAMKRTGITFTLLWLIAAGPALADATTEFAALLEEHWQWTLKNSPMMASRIGDRRYSREWRDDSVGAIEQRQQETREFLRRTYAIDRGGLSEENRLNHELFRRQLENTVDAFQFNGHLMPFSQRGGVQNLDGDARDLRFVTVQDYEERASCHHA